MPARPATEWEPELRERQAVLAKELDQAREVFEEKTKAVRDELARIDGMLRALTGQVVAKAGGKRAHREGGGVPGFTNEEVLPLIEGFLREGGALTEKEIFERTKAKAKEIGKNAQGLHFRIKGALKDSRFALKNEKWSLA